MKNIIQSQFLQATSDGDLYVVKQYVEGGGNINKRDSDGWSGIINASYKNHVHIVQYLAEKGANLNLYIFESRHTALMKAAQEFYLPIVEILIEFGADVTMKNKYGSTALDMLNEHIKSAESVIRLVNEIKLRKKLNPDFTQVLRNSSIF